MKNASSAIREAKHGNKWSADWEVDAKNETVAKLEPS